MNNIDKIDNIQRRFDCRTESIVLNEDYFNYERKDDGLNTIIASVKITPFNIEFFEKHPIDGNEFFHSFKINVGEDYSSINLTDSLYSGTLFKKQVGIFFDDNKEFIREIDAEYDNYGQLIESNISFDPLNMSKEDYIKSRLINSPEVIKLHNYLEKLAPGISYFLAQINPDYSILMNDYNKEDKKCIKK